METKRLIAACCERAGLTLLAQQTDEDPIHVDVECTATLEPSDDGEFAQGILLAFLAGEVPSPQKGVWEGAPLDSELLHWHGGGGQC